MDNDEIELRRISGSPVRDKADRRRRMELWKRIDARAREQVAGASNVDATILNRKGFSACCQNPRDFLRGSHEMSNRQERRKAAATFRKELAKLKTATLDQHLNDTLRRVRAPTDQGLKI
jgi:hypothetical protein